MSPHATNLALIVIVAVVWLVALALPSSRNLRFLVALGVWSLLAISTGAVPGAQGQLALAALLFGVAYALLAPTGLGIDSMSPAERKADSALRNAFRVLSGSSVRRGIEEVAVGLKPSNMPDDTWRSATRLLRRSAIERLGLSSRPSSTPPSAFLEAGVRVWRSVAWRRVLWGRPKPPSAWDEDVLLRCYQADFDDVIPSAGLVPNRIIHLDEWERTADDLITELLSLELHDDVARRAQATLAEAMSATVAVARGDRSSEAISRQASAAAQLSRAWEELAADREVEQER
ncbi:MAG TPA: hypothetical protein VF802_07870 [Candidatus Limnocylindrales bacterium]